MEASTPTTAGEAEIRRLFDAGDLRAAATTAMRLFGPEILGLLLSLHRDQDTAADAFSLFAEKLWTSLGSFEWRCSMRTWAYVIARRASHDVQRHARRHERHTQPLSAVPELEQMAAVVRTETMTALRTVTRTELAKLRETLPAPDQLLLVLRVDRQLEWSDLALVFLANDASSPEAVTREAARLRKRFQLVKARLRVLADERGLIPR
jgi:RNA polymerase sigma-70 factor (ECF subfamily)